ncbi:hypothetical protein MRS44_013972 [Fusarium solani]|uniref:uncharacterized protein n=1 Tax=Fusarium solani TaxID=169388 RepID=UPI0032C46928|nr:hypothetical protein MRS44_013972 [Fusarium solani]
MDQTRQSSLSHVMNLYMYSEAKGKAQLKPKRGPKPKVFYHGAVSGAPTDELRERAEKNGYKPNEVIYILDEKSDDKDRLGVAASGGVILLGLAGIIQGANGARPR